MQNINTKIEVDEIKKFASVEKIEWTNYHDIVNIHFDSRSFRPDNLGPHMGEFEVTHVDFENKVVEYTKQ